MDPRQLYKASYGKGKKPVGLYDWDDPDEFSETQILINNLVKVKKTNEYSFGGVRLIHTMDDNGGKNAFRLIVQQRDDEMTPEEAKILCNVLKDIFDKEEEKDGSD